MIVALHLAAAPVATCAVVEVLNGDSISCLSMTSRVEGGWRSGAQRRVQKLRA